MLDLLLMERVRSARTMEMTVLYRKNGGWPNEEVKRLANRLLTEVSWNSRYPEYVILLGHYSKEATLRALMGGISYTATQVTGVGSEELPFRPSFI